MMKTRTALVILAAAALLASSLACALPSLPGAGGDDPTADWEVFSDPDGAFSFKHPTGWTTKDITAGEEVAFEWNESGDDVKRIFWFAYAGEDIDDDPFADMSASDAYALILRIVGDDQEVERGTLQSGGYRSYWIVVAATETYHNLVQIVIAPSGEGALVVYFGASTPISELKSFNETIFPTFRIPAR